MEHPGRAIAGSISGTIALVMLLAAPYKVSGAASVNSPVLVELFTSEGCSSCPPPTSCWREFKRPIRIPSFSPSM